MDETLRKLIEEYRSLATPYDHRDWQLHRGQEIITAVFDHCLALYDEEQKLFQQMSEATNIPLEQINALFSGTYFSFKKD